MLWKVLEMGWLYGADTTLSQCVIVGDKEVPLTVTSDNPSKISESHGPLYQMLQLSLKAQELHSYQSQQIKRYHWA